MNPYRRIYKIKNNFKRTEMLEAIVESISLVLFLGVLYWIGCNVKL